MRYMRPMLAVAAVALLPAVAQAQDMVSGPYLGLQGGYTWTQDLETEAGSYRYEADFEDGWTGIVEGGYRLSNGLRAGLEIGYTSSTIGDIAGGPPGRAGGAGDVTAMTYMGVIGYELNAIGPVRPYVSAGVGVATVKLDDAADLFGPGETFNDKDTGVAWQVGAGVAYAVSPNLDLTLGYRFLDTGIIRVSQDGNGQRASFDYQNHTAMVGLRWTFGAPPAPPPRPAAVVDTPPPPPPPPPAAPAPTISRNFTVFFDWDKATLTADAQQVLRNVVENARQGNITAVTVSGHADTSGSPDYNLRLSQRRAEAVREFLVGQGVGSGQITVEAKGETDLLVPTADGVREPSNRRSVIVFPEGSPAS